MCDKMMKMMMFILLFNVIAGVAHAGAIHDAARNGDVSTIKKLLADGTDVDTKDDRGWTALMIAALYNQEEVVSLLLTWGADINVRSRYDEETALMIAKRKGHGGVVSQIMKRRRPGALHAAARNGDIGKIKKLLANGANVNEKSGLANSTALMAASEKGHADIISLLLTQGADVNAKETNGMTALKYAAYYGHTKIVSLLLEHKADVNAKDASGGTALMAAAQAGHTKIVSLLLDQEVDINAQEMNGWTALMIAARNGQAEAVSLLLTQGADVHVKSTKGETASMMADQKGYPEIVSLLVAQGADGNAQATRDRIAAEARRAQEDAVVKAYYKREQERAKGRRVLVISGITILGTIIFLAVSKTTKQTKFAVFLIVCCVISLAAESYVVAAISGLAALGALVSRK